MPNYEMKVNGRELPLTEEEQDCACKLHAFGCCCCLCTLCLSWIPFCCYVGELKERYATVRATEDDAETINKGSGKHRGKKDKSSRKSKKSEGGTEPIDTIPAATKALSGEEKEGDGGAFADGAKDVSD